MVKLFEHSTKKASTEENNKRLIEITLKRIYDLHNHDHPSWSGGSPAYLPYGLTAGCYASLEQFGYEIGN